jgi:hypothetical protein
MDPATEYVVGEPVTPLVSLAVASLAALKVAFAVTETAWGPVPIAVPKTYATMVAIAAATAAAQLHHRLLALRHPLHRLISLHPNAL